MPFIIISALHVSGGFFRPSSGAYKTLCAALGIVMFPAVYRRRDRVPPTTRPVDSRNIV